MIRECSLKVQHYSALFWGHPPTTWGAHTTDFIFEVCTPNSSFTLPQLHLVLPYSNIFQLYLMAWGASRVFSARTFDSIDLLGQENSEPFLQVASGLLQDRKC